MSFEITTTDVWVGEVEDRPGTVADMLEALQRAGADLEFAIVRPVSDVARFNGVLLVAPIVGEAQESAARELGMNSGLHALRIVGPDRPGLVAGVARVLANNGISITGLWAATFEDHSVQYVRVDSAADAKQAARLLAPTLT